MKAAFTLALLLTATASAAPDLNDPQKLETFLDGLIDAELRAHQVAGGVVAVVKGGQVLLAKGYGHADLKRDRPVAADRTLFRVASISKTILWTAVMQLVDQGKLDLHADVNRYLKVFRIPATFPQPITLHHLLTHTAGFEDLLAGLFPENEKNVRPLEQALASRIPSRVRPPGEVVAYSNYGSALAGYIVQVVSGMPYEQYLEERIFQPLGMVHSTIRQPVPAPLARDLSIGYKKGSGNDYEQGNFEFLNLTPAGGVSTTATDMANYMIAHLQNGAFQGVRILSEAAAHDMHRVAFSLDPHIGGPTHGFWERYINGQRVIEHGGDTMYFHSILMLLPEHNVGLFGSFNTASSSAARNELHQAFLDRYFPESLTDVPKSKPDSVAKLRRFVGFYRSTRREYARMLSLMALLEPFGGVVHVTAESEGTLRAWGHRLVHVEPLLFRSLDGKSTVAFREDSQGRITQVIPIPYVCFEKVGWSQTPPLHLIWAGGCLLLFLTSLIAWPIAALTRPPAHRGAFRVVAAWLALALALCALALVSVLAASGESIVNGVSPLLRVALNLGYLMPVLALALATCAYLTWRNRVWSVTMRVHYSLVALAGILFVAWLSSWTLLGVRY
jgi:CubicO group peptidase (beta-lactamase class C family)